MAFTEDLTEFFDAEDGFADEVTLDGVTVIGNFEEADEKGGSLAPARRASFLLPATSVPSLPAGIDGLELVRDSVRYGVHEIEHEEGLARLGLELREHEVLIGFGDHMTNVTADANLDSLLQEHCSIWVDQNRGKWKQMLAASPSDYHDYDFTDLDEAIAYAELHGMQYRLHPLLWSSDTFFPTAQSYPLATAASRRAANIIHIQTVVGNYEGRIAYYDVWNEPIALDGSGLKEMPGVEAVTFEEIGEAFTTARAADADALLGLNEFGCEKPGAKLTKYLELAAWLIDNGYPLDYIGFEGHIHCDDPPTLAQYREAFAGARELELQVFVTEADFRVAGVSGTESVKQTAQATAARNMLIAARLEDVHSVGFWNVKDADSWVYANDGTSYPDEQPCPFDPDGNAKPAWTAVAEEKA